MGLQEFSVMAWRGLQSMWPILMLVLTMPIRNNKSGGQLFTDLWFRRQVIAVLRDLLEHSADICYS